MKKRIRAFFMSLIVRPRMIDTIKFKNKTRYRYRMHLNWYSPLAWLLVLFSLAGSLIKGAAIGFVSTWKATFERSGSTGVHIKTLAPDAEWKYYMYFN